MDRRVFLQVAALGALAAPLLAEARPAAARRAPRIGVLGEANPVPWTVRTSVAEIECRWADGGRDRLPDLAAELINLDLDIMVAVGAGPARAARSVTRALPIVFVTGGDPVEQGLVASLARPGGNLTGLMVPSDAEIAKARLRLLAEAVPRSGSVAVLSNPDNPSSARALGHLRGAASPVVEVSPFEVRSAAEVEVAFSTMRALRLGSLVVLPDALFAIHARRLIDLAAEGRLPAMYGARSFAEAGGLMALHGDMAEVIRRTAAMVARIVEGSMPATLPVESLTHLELTVNVEAARALGLALPRSLLARADAVIRV
jgi:putative tryptophan/tyrosine transport system substrate-binding protein